MKSQLILDVYDEQMFDGFAGGGGASTGIERATGRHVDHAGNHARDALGMHRINHCQTIHHCEDIFALNPHRICEGRKLGLGWFSPDCKHFSKAKGGKPLSKKIRGLALVMLRWARYGTRVIYFENVEEMRTWGPLYTHHSPDCIGDGDQVKCLKGCCFNKPIPEFKGRTFEAFKSALSTGLPADHPDLDDMVEVLTDTEDPGNMRTQVARPEHGLIAAHLTKFTTGGVGQSPTEPLPVISAGSHSPETHGGAASVHGLAAASLVKFRGDVETHPQAPDLNDPAHVVSADGQHHGVASAFMVQNNNGFNRTPHHPVTKPCSTVCGSGSGQALATAKFANTIAYYGNDKDGQAMDTPGRTATVHERFANVESTAISPLTPEQIAGARRVAAFLREHGVVFEGEYATVTVDGMQYVIVDIGMRMLTARELFRAQGFGDDYIIDKAWVVNPKTGTVEEIKLTKEQQIRMCGNSVCPDVAAALVRANSPDLCINRQKRKRTPAESFNRLVGKSAVIA